MDSAAARTPPQPSTETRLAQNVVEQDSGEAKTIDVMKVVRRTDKQRGHSRKHAGFNERWDAMERADQIASGANLRSVWWISPASYGEGHYAVMPDMLAEICIAAGTRRGATVLDPFMGAGTTGLVADRLGRHCIGIELNPEYASLAESRIKGDAGMFADVS